MSLEVLLHFRAHNGDGERDCVEISDDVNENIWVLVRAKPATPCMGATYQIKNECAMMYLASDLMAWHGVKVNTNANTS
jgi:hypothetical protein